MAPCTVVTQLRSARSACSWVSSSYSAELCARSRSHTRIPIPAAGSWGSRARSTSS